MRIVGRVIEPEQDGEVLSFGVDSLAAKDALPPRFYALVLRPGADATLVRARLQEQGLEVTRAVNPAERLAVVRVIIVALVVVLALIGLANLLTASALGLRDHLLDLAVLKAMGLTPARSRPPWSPRPACRPRWGSSPGPRRGRSGRGG